jgi:hypothetical protein
MALVAAWDSPVLHSSLLPQLQQHVLACPSASHQHAEAGPAAPPAAVWILQPIPGRSVADPLLIWNESGESMQGTGQHITQSLKTELCAVKTPGKLEAILQSDLSTSQTAEIHIASPVTGLIESLLHLPSSLLAQAPSRRKLQALDDSCQSSITVLGLTIGVIVAGLACVGLAYQVCGPRHAVVWAVPHTFCC